MLEKAGLSFVVKPSPAEEIHDEAMDPEDLCELNARLKAEAVAVQCQDAVVIGSDTLVFIDQSALGKPRDMAEARQMLRRLAGRRHRVCSAVCVMQHGGTLKLFHENTVVKFKSLSDKEIEAYFERVNPLDKAGAYGIQEHGERIIEGIEGNFDTVMGLPVAKVMAALEAWGGSGDAMN